MEYKQIRVEMSVYTRLSDMRKPGESFNGFFKRVILREESKPR